METKKNKKPEPKKLVEKLYDVMASIDEIQKDKKNEFHNYSYASEYAIKKAVHEQLVKERILFKLEINSVVKDRDSTLIEVSYTFVNVDDQSDGVVGQFFAEGKDSGDKGIYKAITGAIKYILTSTFLIPTGDDAENNIESNPTQSSYRPSTFGEDINPNTCSSCGKTVSEKVAKISLEKYGYIFCYPECQKKEDARIKANEEIQKQDSDSRYEDKKI